MKLRKYNPAFLSEDDLVQGFVVRHDQLETLVHILRDNTGSANQHAIVIAPRGFGKSTLVLRTAIAVRRDLELSRWLIPVVFPEESYQVGSVGELWLEALLQLSAVSGGAHLRKAWEELRKDRDEQRLAARALGALLDFADDKGARLLLIIENLDQLLDGQLSTDAAWTLRKTLLNEPRIMVVATAVHRFEGLDQPDQPMFDLFRRLEIEPLTARECDRVWALVTGARIGTRRAKAVRILTGGNPRLVVMLSGFAQRRDLRGLIEDLDGLIDDNSDYFRQNIEALNGQLRRVFLAVAELWRPSPARAIAEVARLEVNETSAALARLTGQGRVEVARTVGKNHLYQVSERLYSIYYLMRRHGGLEARVRALMDFIKTLFEPEHQELIAEEIARDACGMDEGNRGEHLHVLKHLLEDRERQDLEGFQRLVRSLPTSILKAPDLPDGAKALLKTPAALTAALEREDGAQYLDEAGQTLAEVAHTPSTVASRSPSALLVEGELRALARAVVGHPEANEAHLLGAVVASLQCRDLRTAESALRRGLDSNPQHPQTAILLADVLDLQGSSKQALEVLEAATLRLPEDNEIALTLATHLSRARDRPSLERALHLFETAVPSIYDDPRVLDRRCSVLHSLNRSQEAEQLFVEVLEELSARPQAERPQPNAITATGFELARRAKTEARAMEITRGVTTLFPDSSQAWCSLGRIEYLGGHAEDALSSAKRAQKLDRKNHSAQLLRARCELALGNVKAARTGAESIVRHDPRRSEAWNVLVLVALRGAPEDLTTVVQRAGHRSEFDPQVLHAVAGTVFRGAPAASWEEALSLLEHPSHNTRYCSLQLALVGATRGTEAAVAYLSSRLAQSSSEGAPLRDLQRAAMRIAAAGGAGPLVEALQSSARAPEIEPLIAALRLRLGEIVDAPIEVLEVAEEVNRRTDALIQTGDIWRTDPLAITLPDEQDPPTDELAEINQH